MYRSQTPWSLSPTLRETTAGTRTGAPKQAWKLVKRLFRIVAMLAAIGVGTFIAVSLYQHPMFNVASIGVQGTQRLIPEVLVERTGLMGQNLLSIPVEGVESQLMQDPWIRSAAIQRRLPNHVSLVIQEREPAAVWQTGGRRFFVDKDGTVLEESYAAGSLPVIHDVDGHALTPGDTMNSDAIVLTLTLQEVLPREFNDPPKKYEYLAGGGMVVETQSGKRARFGDSTDFEWKLAVWKALLKQAQEQKLQVNHVDLRFGDRPFFR